MKETKETAIMVSKFIDSTLKSLEDGKFEILKDFTHYIDDFVSIQAGTEGMKSIPEENAKASLVEIESVKDTIYAELASVERKDRRDITAALDGILSIFRIGWRSGYERGLRDAGPASAQDKD